MPAKGALRCFFVEWPIAHLRAISPSITTTATKTKSGAGQRFATASTAIKITDVTFALTASVMKRITLFIIIWFFE